MDRVGLPRFTIKVFFTTAGNENVRGGRDVYGFKSCRGLKRMTDLIITAFSPPPFESHSFAIVIAVGRTTITFSLACYR